MISGIKRGPGKAATFVAAVFVAMVVSVAWAGMASAATGSLEICKAPDNGANGVSFKFTATNLNTGATKTVSVKGGSCSSPMPAGTAKWAVQEDLSNGLWNVTHIAVQPATNALFGALDLANGIIGVKVTADTETQVTFTNAQAAATLKVCKWSGSGAIQGNSFTFNVGGTIVTAVAGPDAADAGCSSPVNVQPGSKITVTETVPAGETVASIVPTASNLKLNSSTGGVAHVTVGSGANVLVYENEPLGPPQTGYIEVCKDAFDTFTTGNFTFTIQDSAGFKDTEIVAVGQCTGPIQVAAGNVTVSETLTASTYLHDVWTLPATNLGPYNLTNGTATVVVVPSQSVNQETQVHFDNATTLASLKVCKVLTSTSSALAGSTFTFGVNPSAAAGGSLSIIASTSPNGACKNYPVLLPVGSTVTVNENGVAFVGANGGAPGAGASSTVTLAPGINTVTFTNQAYGTIEICKNMINSDVAYTNLFQFSVNGGTSFGVNAGRCSGPMTVPAGTATVQEATLKNFTFVSATATGPDGSSRVISGTNPLTVSIPFPGGSGNETLVTFVNKVQRAQFKICKIVDPGSLTPLGGLNFNFLWTTVGNGTTTNSTAGVTPPYDGPGGSCTGILGPTGGVPVVNPNGTATTITVVENGLGGIFKVQTIAVDNGTTASSNTATGTVVVNPNVGIVTITYTNVSS